MSNKTGLLRVNGDHIGKTIIEILRTLGFNGVSSIQICRVRDDALLGHDATPNYVVRVSDLVMMIAFQYKTRQMHVDSCKGFVEVTSLPVSIGNEHDQKIDFGRVVRQIRVGRGKYLSLFNIVSSSSIKLIELTSMDYDIVRIDNPIDPAGEDWLIVKDTKIGDTVTSFLRKCHVAGIEILE